MEINDCKRIDLTAEEYRNIIDVFLRNKPQRRREI